MKTRQELGHPPAMLVLKRQRQHISQSMLQIPNQPGLHSEILFQTSSKQPQKHAFFKKKKKEPSVPWQLMGCTRLFFRVNFSNKNIHCPSLRKNFQFEKFQYSGNLRNLNLSLYRNICSGKRIHKHKYIPYYLQKNSMQLKIPQIDRTSSPTVSVCSSSCLQRTMASE